MNTYQYEPIHLERPTFRLLRLLKGAEPSIKCQLFEAWLDHQDLVQYDALSYTWGGNDLSESVEMDGKALRITENLYWALWNLRFAEADRIIWVDAICIDQSNHQERGHQVRQMGKVYSQADRVVIWLGPATDDINALLGSLKRMEHESNKLACGEWALANSRWQCLWSSLQLELKSSYWNLAARQRAGLESLMKRAWFKRIWILQEVAKAKRATICSGNWSVSTRIFVLAPSLLLAKPEAHCQAVLDIMPGSLRRESWWDKKRDLYTLLSKFRGSQASDPRDMVYALLGICSDVQESCIPVDYTKEPQEVMKDTASFLFDLPDCSYNTVTELMQHADSLNADYLMKVVKSDNAHRARTFLRLRGDEVSITEEVIRAAVANKTSGDQMIEVLIDQRANEVRVTIGVVKAAATNTECGQRVLDILCGQYGQAAMLAAVQGGREVLEHIIIQRVSQVRVTEEVVKAAAANKRSGKEVMQLLLDRRVSEIRVTEEVVKAAAANESSGEEVMQLLIKQPEVAVDVTEELVANIARSFSVDCIKLLLDRRRSEVRVTEEVVKAAAANKRRGKEVMQLLLGRRGSEVRVTKKVVKATAANEWRGEEVMHLLLDQRGSEVRVTEEVVKAAAANELSGEKVMHLLDQRGSEVRVTEEVVKAAAANERRGEKVMHLLLDQRGSEVRVTEEVVKAAAANISSGEEVMQLLLDQRGSEVRVTEEVVKAAAANELSGEKVMQLLLDQRGSEVRVTKEVVKAAAANKRRGKEVMELLLT